MRGGLIGRDVERGWLEEAVAAAEAGQGSLVLLSGEAGIGKTRLAEDVAEASDALALRGAASPSATLPYGPMLGALRGYLRSEPGALASCGPLQGHLALLLPELGPAVAESDRATLFESLRCALATIASGSPAVILLDDLQWSDDATLELLGALADPLRELPILVVGAYRSDEVPRAHPLRGLRNELRRARRAARAGARAARRRGERPRWRRRSSARSRRPRSRARCTTARRASRSSSRSSPGALQSGGAPDRGRARARARRQRRDPRARDDPRRGPAARRRPVGRRHGRAAEAASVAGPRFDLELVASLDGDAGLAALIDSGLVAEAEPGTGAFRHALARDAIYEDVPWPRRRALHRRLAEALDARGGPGVEVGLALAGRARGPAGARRAAARARGARRRCTPTATRPAPPAARSSCGQRASARPSASRCSSATRAAPSSRAI